METSGLFSCPETDPKLREPEGFPGYTSLEMPDDTIMNMVDNIEEMHSDKNALFDRWMDKGEDWNEGQALVDALALAAHFAEHLEAGYVDGKYGEREIRAAADRMIEQFGQYRDDEIEERLKNATRKATAEDLRMDPGDIEHARKYDDLAKKIGIEKIKSLIPVSSAKVRQALERGDRHLNSISLRKWDQAALNLSLRERGLTLSEGVCVLKHVAKWHYGF